MTTSNNEIDNYLDDALVPEEEQPYEIPDNWIWVRIENIFINVTDSMRKIKQKDYLKDGSYPIIDQGMELIGGYTNNSEFVHKSLLPVIIFGDHTKIVKYIDFNFVQGADGVKVLKPNDICSIKYFYYSLKILGMPNKGYSRHYKYLKNLSFPLPPLEEQKRVVDKLDSLLGKIREAKELIQEARDTFKLRRQVILAKAFRGELTKDWREENGFILLSSWRNVLLDNIQNSLQNGLSTRKGYLGKERIVLRLADVENRLIVINNARMIKITDDEYEKYRLTENDILIIRVNGSENNVGQFLLCNLVGNSTFCDHLIRLKVKEDLILPKYLIFLSETNAFRSFILTNKVSSAGQNTISQTSLLKIPITLPPLEEQKEIVKRVERLLELEDKAKELLDMDEHLDLLEKSILAKAFCGELGTGNPDDEPAIKLLERILREREKNR